MEVAAELEGNMTRHREKELITDEVLSKATRRFHENQFIYWTGGTYEAQHGSLRSEALYTLKEKKKPVPMSEFLKRAARIDGEIGYDPKTVGTGLRLHQRAKPSVYFLLERDEFGNFIAVKDIPNPDGYAQSFKEGEIVLPVSPEASLKSFEIGNVYNRKRDIHAVFGGQHQGGISTPKNYQIVFAFTGSSGKKHGYKDYWTDDGAFCLYGEGQKGDMRFKSGNKAIRDHIVNGKELLLFEMLGRGRVRFEGQFACESWHFSRATDTEGVPRKAIVFHLFPLGNDDPIDLAPNENVLTLKELRKLALSAVTSTPERKTKPSKKSFIERSRDVRRYVCHRANGTCECCGNLAPFNRSDGSPFLEVHHIRRLTDGGPDDPRFMGGICPNCHKEIHHGVNGSQINEELQRTVTAKEAEQES